MESSTKIELATAVKSPIKTENPATVTIDKEVTIEVGPFTVTVGQKKIVITSGISDVLVIDDKGVVMAASASGGQVKAASGGVSLTGRKIDVSGDTVLLGS